MQPTTAYIDVLQQNINSWLAARDHMDQLFSETAHGTALEGPQLTVIFQFVWENNRSNEGEKHFYILSHEPELF